LGSASSVRRAARLVSSLYKYEPVKTELTIKLQWLLPVSDYNYKLLLLLYTIIKGDCPPYFTHTLGIDITLNDRTSSSAKLTQSTHTLFLSSYEYFSFNLIT